jgi:pimeloyl-ACP methyl ester carboxylesterase
VLGLLQHVGHPLALVGHSFGGAVAMKAALRLGPDLAGLVLLDPNPFYLLAMYGRDAAYAEAAALRDHVKRTSLRAFDFGARVTRTLVEGPPSPGWWRQLRIVLDNYGTHKHPKVQAWLARNPRVQLHVTSTSASWLTLVLVNRPWEEAATRAAWGSHVFGVGGARLRSEGWR